MKTLSKHRRSRSLYKRFLALLTLITVSSYLTTACAVLPVKDSVQNFTKEYLGKVLSESFKKSKEDFPGQDQASILKSEKYIQSEFGKYFTDSGYELFVSEEVFARRLGYFRENDIQKILNIIITVSASQGSDEKEDEISYDYRIEYYAIDADNGSEKITDSGVLQVIKEKAGSYIIDSDEINYSDVFS